MTKSRHNSLLLAFVLFFCARARAGTAYECVRDLMPITEQASFQAKRKGYEKPFIVSEKYIVFPEVGLSYWNHRRKGVTGFYVYAPGKAWYYDTAEIQPGKTELIADMKATADHVIYDLTAQPDGLETITVPFMPGFGVKETDGEGPVILGASVLPVVGALVSRPNDPLQTVYHNPDAAEEGELKSWIYNHMSRRPADVSDIQITHQIVHLSTYQTKTRDQMWRPLNEELEVRRHWVKTHNLDESTFKQWSRLMQTTCKESGLPKFIGEPFFGTGK